MGWELTFVLTPLHYTRRGYGEGAPASSCDRDIGVYIFTRSRSADATEWTRTLTYCNVRSAAMRHKQQSASLPPTHLPTLCFSGTYIHSIHPLEISIHTTLCHTLMVTPIPTLINNSAPFHLPLALSPPSIVSPTSKSGMNPSGWPTLLTQLCLCKSSPFTMTTIGEKACMFGQEVALHPVEIGLTPSLKEYCNTLPPYHFPLKTK